jgi:dihydrofolate reductase
VARWRPAVKRGVAVGKHRVGRNSTRTGEVERQLALIGDDHAPDGGFEPWLGSGIRQNREPRGDFMRIVVITHLTLDGVMQAPAEKDEDSRGGFAYGGWETPYGDAEMMQSLGFGGAPRERDNSASGGGLLLGRRTYEHFYSVWPKRTDNPFTEVLNRANKYVASRTLREPLPWMNSTLLHGDVSDAVRRLKSEPGERLVVLGSGELSQTLMRAELIDEYLLLIHPLVLGTGRRLFADGCSYAKLELVQSKTTTKGVIIATYHRA